MNIARTEKSTDHLITERTGVISFISKFKKSSVLSNLTNKDRKNKSNFQA